VLFLSTSNCNRKADEDGEGWEEEEDALQGLLTVDEVVDLSLAPGCVVVLSACSTAIGDVKGAHILKKVLSRVTLYGKCA
jgi:hypothetical protein